MSSHMSSKALVAQPIVPAHADRAFSERYLLQDSDHHVPHPTQDIYGRCSHHYATMAPQSIGGATGHSGAINYSEWIQRENVNDRPYIPMNMDLKLVGGYDTMAVGREFQPDFYACADLGRAPTGSGMVRQPANLYTGTSSNSASSLRHMNKSQYN